MPMVTAQSGGDNRRSPVAGQLENGQKMAKSLSGTMISPSEIADTARVGAGLKRLTSTRGSYPGGWPERR